LVLVSDSHLQGKLRLVLVDVRASKEGCRTWIPTRTQVDVLTPLDPRKPF
jgi:hypothetical protein